MKKYIVLFCVACLAFSACSSQVKQQSTENVHDDVATSQAADAGRNVTEAGNKVGSETTQDTQSPIDLILQELALELRMKEESDSEKKDELKLKMSKLRQQRQSLYQHQVKGQ